MTSGTFTRAVSRTPHIRSVEPADAGRLRELRLRALRDAPAAFATALGREETRPNSYWHQLSAAASVGSESCILVACAGEEWIGMVAGRWFDHSAGLAQIWGLWVEPAFRGQGVARTLLDGVAGWASAHGAEQLRLGVIGTASDLVGLYEHLGFALTGETKLLPRDGSTTAVFLARRLS